MIFTALPPLSIPRLKLVHKGILLVALPLLIQTLFYMELKNQLHQAQQQAQSQEASKKIVARVNVLILDSTTLFEAITEFMFLQNDRTRARAFLLLNKSKQRIEQLSEIILTDGHDPDEAQKIRALGNRYHAEIQISLKEVKHSLEPIDVAQTFIISAGFRHAASSLMEELNAIALREESRVVESNEEQSKFRAEVDRRLDVAVAFNTILAVVLAVFFVRGTVSSLSVLKNNARLLAGDQPLLRPINSADEIGEVDRVFHEMAAALKNAAQREKHMTDKLRLSEERLRSVIQSVPVALIVADPAGRIESINPTAEQLFSYSQKQVAQQNLDKLLRMNVGPDKGRPVIERLLEETATRLATMEAISREHEFIPVEVSVIRFETSAGPKILATVIDVTERYKLEQLKREFVAMVSHDIRTPLSSIRGIFELLRSGGYGELPPEAKTKIELADENTFRLLQMVNKLLDLEKLDAGMVELSRRPFPLKELYDAALPMVADLAGAHDVAIATDSSELCAWGDLEMLQQVLINLLSNAICYSPAGGSIEVSAQATGREITVRVRDQGPGIALEKRSEIFERFKQSDIGRDRRKGYGLGLAICKAIVSQHGEQIGVTSEEGEGSTFWFTIAKAAVDSPRLEPSESAG